MFILTTISDVIQIEPADFYKPSAEALEDNINHKYANKVIQKVGLCICFFDLLKASDGLIGHGDGLVNVNVKFRLVVFRPFKGEIIEGTIADSSPSGIRITLDFLDTIQVPAPTNLFHSSHFDAAEQVWIWTNEIPAANETSPDQPASAEDKAATTKTPFYFDRNERVRFRVEEEIWTDLAPLGPTGRVGATGSTGRGNSASGATAATLRERAGQVNGSNGAVPAGQGITEGRIVEEGLTNSEVRKARTPYRIVGSMQQGGLGVTSWW